MGRSLEPMAYEATSTARRERAPAAFAGAGAWRRLRASAAWADAWRITLATRLGVFAVALYASLSTTGGTSAANAARFDLPALTHPFGGFGDIVFSPLARWDSVWFLSIANGGYPEGSPRTAFFPLYPMLTRVVGELSGGSRGAMLVAAYAVSLGALLAALVVLHRLTELELGAEAARPAVLLLAVFPGALFLGAPYSESVFLLASVGAFYAARTGRWAWAGAAAAAASATRSAGVLLLVPLLIVWWQAHAPGRRVRPELAWLALAPVGLLAYALFLGIAHGDPLAFSSAQELWDRSFAGPFAGVADGTVAAWDGARQLLSGSRDHVYFTAAGGDPFRVASINLMLFGSLVFAAVALVGVFRRLPLAYGAYVLVALALPLSFPVGPQPLMSLPRFLVVLFPVFMWMGAACARRGWTAQTASVSALVLGLFTAQYATWYFVA